MTERSAASATTVPPASTVQARTVPPGTAARKAALPGPDDPENPHGSRQPDSPVELPARSWKYASKRAVGKFSSDGCTDLAASLTYYSVLSLFPAVLALVSIMGLVGQAEHTTELLLEVVANATDQSAVETIEGPLRALTESRAAGWTLAAGLVTALWSASAYVGAFSRAMNKIYGIDEGRPVWKLRPALLLVTFAAVVMVAVMALMLLLSGSIATAVGEAFGVGPTALTVWNFAKWPVLAVLAIVLIALLYYFTPNVRQPKFRWISVGAAVAFLALVLASAGFGIYVANFDKYEKTYGTIAGLIVLLLWLWIMNLMLLFGAELDAELERVRQLQGGIAAEEQLQLPPRGISASLKKEGKAQELVAEGRALRSHFDAEYGEDALRSGEARTLVWLAGAGAVALVVATIRKRWREK